jgi:hypothetical protein
MSYENVNCTLLHKVFLLHIFCFFLMSRTTEVTTAICEGFFFADIVNRL